MWYVKSTTAGTPCVDFLQHSIILAELYAQTMGRIQKTSIKVVQSVKAEGKRGSDMHKLEKYIVIYIPLECALSRVCLLFNAWSLQPLTPRWQDSWNLWTAATDFWERALVTDRSHLRASHLSLELASVGTYGMCVNGLLKVHCRLWRKWMLNWWENCFPKIMETMDRELETTFFLN